MADIVPADPGTQPTWKRYPFVLCAEDPLLAFPQAEGDHGAESNSFGERFPLAAAAAAPHYIQDRKNVGKVVLVP